MRLQSAFLARLRTRNSCRACFKNRLKKGLTILFTSAGRRNQLIECFRRSAQALDVEVRFVTTDLNPHLSSACTVSDQCFAVPRCSDPAFIPAVLEICRAEKVDLVVPTIDPELTPLSQHQAEFAALGTKVVISSPDVTMLAHNKFETARVLAAAGVPVPRTVQLRDFLKNPQELAWPVIAKPNAGSASVGILRPHVTDDLLDLPIEDYIVQELWEGREYTVNLFVDSEGRLQGAVPHLRIEVRGGEVSKGRTERRPELVDAAQKIIAALPGARGPLCFQVIVRTNGSFCVFEINARFGGGYPLAHEAGATFTRWLIEEHLGLASSAHDNWQEGLTMLRYDSAVFLHA
jgi:carbamoyl-phosphate synthase large subunit